MGKRFAMVIGVAAAGVMALGAQSATAVVEYDTKLTINKERGGLFYGSVRSDVRKCKVGRRVVLFKRRPGADRKLGTDRSGPVGNDRASWQVDLPRGVHGHKYANVRRKVGDRFMCRSNRADH